MSELRVALQNLRGPVGICALPNSMCRNPHLALILESLHVHNGSRNCNARPSSVPKCTMDSICIYIPRAFRPTCTVICISFLLFTAHDRKCARDKPYSDECPFEPCSMAKCSNFPKAKCINDYCGGCGYQYVLNGRNVTEKCGKG